HMHRFSKFSRSLTSNYCEVFVKCPPNLTGKLAYLKITHYSRGRLYGRLIGNNLAVTTGIQETQ
ncbi:MAG: hypothetical protein KAX38_03375, partial [Candidatus Krumholzibacteria bacterium]|nr:hypothetical protein [Candidatus Krumholzibacteria bacterium]